MPRTTSATEAELSYKRHGDGQPLLLLHGGMAPMEFWQPILPQFEELAPVVPQRPGFGTCLDDPEETSAQEVLQREVEYVERLAGAVDGEPIVLGHSFGGLTAIESATGAPVEAVAAYEPAVLPEQYRQQADLADRMESLIEAGKPEEAVKRYVEQVLHPDGIEDMDAWLSAWPVWPECVGLAREVVRMNRAVEGYSLPDQLTVEKPVLVMSGTEGPDFLRESARGMHEALPQSRFVEFDGVSHSGPGEAPCRISEELRVFCETT